MADLCERLGANLSTGLSTGVIMSNLSNGRSLRGCLSNETIKRTQLELGFFVIFYMSDMTNNNALTVFLS